MALHTVLRHWHTHGAALVPQCVAAYTYPWVARVLILSERSVRR